MPNLTPGVGDESWDLCSHSLILDSSFVSVQEHFTQSIEYCRRLKASSFPSRWPQDALQAIEQLLESLRRAHTASLKNYDEFALFPALAIEQAGDDKTTQTQLLTLMAKSLREIRNARYGIVPTFVIPYVDATLGEILSAYEGECRGYVRRHKALETTEALGERRVGERALRDVPGSAPNQAESGEPGEPLVVRTYPIISGVEPQGQQIVVTYELAPSTPFPNPDSGHNEWHWPIFLHFPVQDRHCALLYPLFFHEIAHLVMLLERPGRPASQSPLQDDSAAVWAEDFARELDPEKILRTWKEEVIADIVATKIAGPAYPIAFWTFITRGTDYSPTRRHPSPLLRLEWMLGALTELNYSPADVTCLQGLVAPLRKKLSAAPSEPDLDEIEKTLLASGRTLARAADGLVGELAQRNLFKPFSREVLVKRGSS